MLVNREAATPSKEENGKLYFKNTFSRAKNEWLTLSMIKMGLSVGAIKPEDVPKDVMKAVEDSMKQ